MKRKRFPESAEPPSRTPYRPFATVFMQRPSSASPLRGPLFGPKSTFFPVFVPAPIWSHSTSPWPFWKLSPTPMPGYPVYCLTTPPPHSGHLLIQLSSVIWGT